MVASAWARGAMPIGPKGLPRGPAVAGRGFKHRPTALAWPRVPAVAGRGSKNARRLSLGRWCLRWPAGGLNTARRLSLGRLCLRWPAGGLNTARRLSLGTGPFVAQHGERIFTMLRSGGPHRGIAVWSPCARARVRPGGPGFSSPVGAGLSARPKPFWFSFRDCVCLLRRHAVVWGT